MAKTHGDDDPDGGRVAVQAQDLDGAAVRSASPVLDGEPHEQGDAEAVGVSVGAVRCQPSSPSHTQCGEGETDTTEVAAPRRVKSYEYAASSR